MTNRLMSLTVVLERDLREDDAEPILEAIRLLKGVVSVEGNVADHTHYAAYRQARVELEAKLWKALAEPLV